MMLASGAAFSVPFFGGWLVVGIAAVMRWQQ